MCSSLLSIWLILFQEIFERWLWTTHSDHFLLSRLNRLICNGLVCGLALLLSSWTGWCRWYIDCSLSNHCCCNSLRSLRSGSCLKAIVKETFLSFDYNVRLHQDFAHRLLNVLLIIKFQRMSNWWNVGACSGFLNSYSILLDKRFVSDSLITNEWSMHRLNRAWTDVQINSVRYMGDSDRWNVK